MHLAQKQNTKNTDMIKKYFVENLTPYQLKTDNATCQFYVNTRDYTLEHSHEDYWEFCVVLSGIIDNNKNGEIETCAEGTMFYSTTNDVHFITTRDKSPVQYINFTIAEKTILQLISVFSPNVQQLLKQNTRNFTLPSEMVFATENLLHKLNMLPPEKCEIANDLILAEIMGLVQYAANKIYGDKLEDEPIWMKELLRLKQKECFITYTVDDLCRELNYSRVQLNRLFRAKFNSTPHGYLMENKLLYAQNLLTSTDMNTMDIANAIGYANLAQFNIVFKKRFGVTPGQYRK